MASVDGRGQGKHTGARSRRFLGLIRLSLLVSLLVLAAPSTAQATFQPLGRVSQAQQGAKTPQVAVAPNGTAVYVWAHYDGTDPDGTDAVPTCCWRVEARTRSATGTLGSVLSVSPAGKNGTLPQVAVDSTGNAYITWVLSTNHEPTPTDGMIQTRRLSSTGSLSAIQNLTPSGLGATEPQVGVDPNGNAAFSWARFDGSASCSPQGCPRIQIRRRTAAGALSSTQTLSNAGQLAFSNQIAVDNGGNAVVAWTAFVGSKDEIQVRRRASGGALSAIQTVSGTKESTQPQVAVRPSNGDAVIIWIENSTTTSDVVMGRARTSGGTLSAIQTLSTTGAYSEEAQVAVDANGNAIFIWERFDGTTGTCCWRIETRTRTQAGTLGTAQIHSAAGQTALAPQIGFDSAGTAVFLWGRSDGTSASCCSIIQTRSRTSSGTLSTIKNLSLTGRNALEPQIAVDPNGNTVYAWTRSDGSYARVQGRRRASNGTLNGLVTLSSVGPDATAPQVAVDPSGNALFAWVAFDGVHTSIQGRPSTAAGVLGAVQQLSDATQDASQVQIGVDQNGNALFVWKRSDGFNTRIEARTRSSTGTLGAVEVLSGSGANADNPQVAVDPNGNAVIAWTRSDGTNVRVEAVARASTGALSAVQVLSPAGQNASEPQAGIDAAGDAVFAWTRSDGANFRIETIARAAAGTLSAVQVLSPAGQNASQPELGVRSSTGDAVFTWTRSDGNSLRIQTRARIAAGTLSTIKSISLAGQNASQPEIGVDAAGNAVYSWTRFDGTVFRVQTAARTAAGTVSTPQSLSATGSSAGLAQLGVDAAGNAVIVWRLDGADRRIQSRTRSSTGTLGVLDPISNATQDADLPQVGVNATGKAFAVWQRFDGKKSRIEGAVGP